MDNARKIRLAVVGCGAVARIHHLPSITASNRFELIALVDRYLPNAQKLGEEYGIPAAVEDYGEIAAHIDAAIVALPNYLHATVSIDLLRRGIHVLVEKPMALSSRECETMISAASVPAQSLRSAWISVSSERFNSCNRYSTRVCLATS